MSGPPDGERGDFRVKADKRLGQHFLHDPAILTRIAAAATPLAGCTTVEVGPGPGGLTEALLAAGAERLVAIERDPRFLPGLQTLSARWPGRLELIEADAMTIQTASLARGVPLRIVANLPYNVGTELLVGWLERIEGIELMVLMFQKEVALRLAAAPGGKDYGRISVLAQAMCRVERLFDLPPGAFRPPPRVASSVVRLAPHATHPSPELRRALSSVTRAAFGRRRKMLRSSLGGLPVPAERLLEAARIAPTRRAEELTVAQFLELAALVIESR